MKTSLTRFPDLQSLAVGLNCLLQDNGSTGDLVTVLDRDPSVHACTFSSEIVTCRLGIDRVVQLFCKYALGRTDSVYGYRGGVRREAEVYERVLRPMQVSTPRFYGSREDASSGLTWLVLEHLNDCERLDMASEPAATMVLAARWIGRFHTLSTARLATDAMPFLPRYDADYYAGWVRRTSTFAGQLHKSFPWLADLCERGEELLAPLSQLPATVIHGEYYPQNVLFREGVIYPVDWESAAIGPGEIDLAALTEVWPQGITEQCELEYQRARWPGGAPEDFERSIAAARCYLSFRWLGERPEWTIQEGYRYYFERLRGASESRPAMSVESRPRP